MNIVPFVKCPDDLSFKDLEFILTNVLAIKIWDWSKKKGFLLYSSNYGPYLNSAQELGEWIYSFTRNFYYVEHSAASVEQWWDFFQHFYYQENITDEKIKDFIDLTFKKTQAETGLRGFKTLGLHYF